MVTIKIDKSQKCNGDYSLYISFNYNTEIVNIMRQQSIRYYNPDTKEWEIPFKKLDEIKNQLNKFNITMLDSHKILSNFNFER